MKNGVGLSQMSGFYEDEESDGRICSVEMRFGMIRNVAFVVLMAVFHGSVKQGRQIIGTFTFVERGENV